jgi:hypothetical protein
MMSQNKDKQPKIEQPDFPHPQLQSYQPIAGQVYSSAPDLNSLSNQIQDALNKINNLMEKRINFNTDIIGLFETVSAVPTGIPASPYQQIKIYVNGATLRLYWYDGNANVWHYVTATA